MCFLHHTLPTLVGFGLYSNSQDANIYFHTHPKVGPMTLLPLLPGCGGEMYGMFVSVLWVPSIENDLFLNGFILVPTFYYYFRTDVAW